MKLSSFALTLLLLSALTAIILWILGQYPLFLPHRTFSFICLLLFILLSVLLYWLSVKASRNQDPKAFLRLIMGSVMIKLWFSIALILIYFYAFDPANKMFLVPFFILYVVYTGFEVYFMMNLGRKQPSTT